MGAEEAQRIAARHRWAEVFFAFVLALGLVLLGVWAGDVLPAGRRIVLRAGVGFVLAGTIGLILTRVAIEKWRR